MAEIAQCGDLGHLFAASVAHVKGSAYTLFCFGTIQFKMAWGTELI
jgi:hypothetical protein